MSLDVKMIKPLNGSMNCYIIENKFTGLPMSLFYSIEIPLEKFDTGHDYVEQPSETSIAIDWILFKDAAGPGQEKNWKKLVGKKFNLSYEDKSAEGSIYLGSEHCYLNCEILFGNLTETVFDIEIVMAIDYNIETINLDPDGLLRLSAKLNFEGLRLTDAQLPPFQNDAERMQFVNGFIEPSVYNSKLVECANEYNKWRQLIPK
jgi:hypothetical protein